MRKSSAGLLVALIAVATAFAVLSRLVEEGSAAKASAESDGVIRTRSAYGMDETVARLKQDIANKGITYFLTVEQSKLAAAAGVSVRPSVLMIFGNPPLGTQFLNASQVAGLDWPVRLLVFEDAQGQVWTAYSDFLWIARRHRIAEQSPAFQMASKVIASITSSVAAK